MGIHAVKFAYSKHDPVHRIHTLKMAGEFFGNSKKESNRFFS